MKIITAHTPPYSRIRTEAFWDRFTQAELVAYEVAAFSPVSATPTNAQKKDAAKLRLFRRDADVTRFRNLSKTKIRDFVLALETQSDTMGGTLLAVGRATVILDTAITADEAYIVPGEMA